MAGAGRDSPASTKNVNPQAPNHRVGRLFPAWHRPWLTALSRVLLALAPPTLPAPDSPARPSLPSSPPRTNPSCGPTQSISPSHAPLPSSHRAISWHTRTRHQSHSHRASSPNSQTGHSSGRPAADFAADPQCGPSAPAIAAATRRCPNIADPSLFSVAAPRSALEHPADELCLFSSQVSPPWPPPAPLRESAKMSTTCVRRAAAAWPRHRPHPSIVSLPQAHASQPQPQHHTQRVPQQESPPSHTPVSIPSSYSRIRTHPFGVGTRMRFHPGPG